MKIALISGDSSRTGVPSHILRLAAGLRVHKFDVLLVAPKGPLLALAKKEKIAVAEVPMGSPFDRKAIGAINKILKDFDPQIIHCHGVRGGWLGRLAARNIKTAKKVYTEHLWTNYYHLSNPAYEQFQLRGLKFLERWTDKTIAVSNSVRDFLIRKGFEKNKIVVIPNGINPIYLKNKPIQKPKEMPVVIGSVGSLNQLKNYRNTILGFERAVKENPDLDLHYQIIGEGPLEKSLKAMVQKKGLAGRVHFSSRVEDILDRLKHFTIFINTSLSESFGLSAAEAMGLGLPVVVSNFGGLKELVCKECAIEVNPRNTAEIAAAITKLAGDAALRQKLGAAGKTRIGKMFSEEKMIERTIGVYRELLGQ